MQAWERVLQARDPSRLSPEVIVDRLVTCFVALHGDRLISDDPAMLTGVGLVGEERIAIVAHRPGASDAGATGLRQAQRMAALAERFGLALVTLIHVRGLYPHDPGLGALWLTVGQTLDALMNCRAPSVAVLVGEGVSGGALALCVTDRLICLENAYLAPTSPEGVSAILWKDAQQPARAAALIAGNAENLVALGLCHTVVSEAGGDEATLVRLNDALRAELRTAQALPSAERLERRRQRFLSIGGIA